MITNPTQLKPSNADLLRRLDLARAALIDLDGLGIEVSGVDLGGDAVTLTVPNTAALSQLKGERVWWAGPTRYKPQVVRETWNARHMGCIVKWFVRRLYEETLREADHD